MSTGILSGIALPHAKTSGAGETSVAVGIKKTGINFDSLDGEKSFIFIMTVSPQAGAGRYFEFLTAIAAVLNDTAIREKALGAQSKEELAEILHQGRLLRH
jgi:mannitol/fructose-specific phosphotransferase system IIA component (Ntr-type)